MSPELAAAIRAAADAVQWGALITIVGVLALILVAGWYRPEWRRVLFFPLVYSVLAVGFYVVTLLNLVPAPLTSLLSAGLRFYNHVLMLIVGLVFLATRLAAEFRDDGSSGEDGGDDGC